MAQGTLLKSLMAAGLGSRRHLADTIRQGKIQVNGEIIEDFSYPVNFRKDIILVDGNPVKPELKPRIVLLLNKPAGVLSTTKDDRGRKTVMDILPQKYRNIMPYPVGRLDKDTTGLLLLTNDGELTYQLTHPKFEHEKEYLICIRSKLSPDEELNIERGIQLDDGITYPAVLKETEAYPPFNYSLTIHEGKKRQIHRMLAKFGHKVLALRRTRIGGLRLGKLKEGEVREISTQEIERLLQYPK
jgi:23S rRNA pseudouridine2605 synthase